MTNIIISPLSAELIFKDFNCGVKDVNEYLHSKAIDQEKEKITKIYVIHKNKEIIAYSAIFCSHLYFKLPNQEREFRVPGICIGQLGIDQKYQRKGLGNILIKHTIAVGKRIGLFSGCRIIYVEAIDDAVDYYKKLQFELIEVKSNRNRMIFDLF